MFGSRQGYLRGIRDATNVTNNANCTVNLSTTQSKIGQSSANFDGATTSTIFAPSSNRFNRGQNPFTLECWFYQTAITNRFPGLFGNGNESGYGSGRWALLPHYDVAGSGPRRLVWALSPSLLVGGTTLALNAWHHVAVVRTAATGAVMTSSSINGSGVLTVGTLSSGTITTGLSLSGTNVVAGTYIQSNISGAGSGSTWQTNAAGSVASTTITGNNLVMYANGVVDARQNMSANLTGASNYRFAFGTYTNAANDFFIGYMDEARFSTVARYFTGFTPQTTPFLNDPDTLFLMHFDGTNNTKVWTDDNT